MNVYKNKIRSILLLLIAITVSCNAQNQSRDSTSLPEGSWALQFGIDRDFTLKTFQGSTIGAKYQLSEKHALRGGLTFSGNASDGSNSISGEIGGIDAGTVPENSSGKSFGVNLILQYLWYFNPAGPVHFYSGFGPMVSYSYSKNSSDDYNISISNGQGYWIRYQYDYKNTQWAVGAAAVVGVEWFACRWLSIHADYNEAFQYQWLSSSRYQFESSSVNPSYLPLKLDSSGSIKGWALTSLGVAFGLNIYL
jgi:hypothetical protein